MERLFVIKPPKIFEYCCTEAVCPRHKSWQSERERKAECQRCSMMKFSRELSIYDQFTT